MAVDLANTVYVLDSTIIDLCLSVLLGACFRATKAKVKVHALLNQTDVEIVTAPAAFPV